MAIAVDATNGAYVGSGNTTVTATLTVSGANRLIIAFVVDQDYLDATGTNTTGVTYDSVSMTKIGSARVNGNDVWVHLYALLAPNTGTHDAVASRTAGVEGFYIFVRSYTGVDQGTAIGSLPNQTGQGGNVTSFTGTVTTTADNSYTAMVAYGRGGSNTAGAGTVVIQQQDESGSWQSNGAVATAGSTTLTVNQSNGWYGYVIVGFAPSTIVGPTSVKTWDGVTQSTGVNTYLGTALASVKSVDGIT